MLRRFGAIRSLRCVALIATLALSGCALAPEARPILPEPEVPVARELEKVSLPRYVIEPPDILLIDALRVVPKSPFRIEPLDILYIDVTNEFPEAQINGPYPVEPGGAVDLGSQYGKVQVDGLSLDEATDAVTRHLRRTLADPLVSLTLYQSAGQQQIVGEHLVGPDGTINLGVYGQVYVAGMTIPEATDSIREYLTQYVDETVISVDVLAYNSKVYYIVTEGAGLGDNIVKVPVTGNETVLDAVSQVGGLSRVSSKKIWIARPSPDGSCYQHLPVKWSEVARYGSSVTNYQILPGDRVFIEEDKWIAADSLLANALAPFERLLNMSLLGANTIQTIQRFPGGFAN